MNKKKRIKLAKIIHYRENCIGCNSCIEHCPTFWKMDEDGKATLKESVKKGEIFVKEINIVDVECNKKAEKDCPVNIIRVIE